jgi:hypothetical protein
MAQGCRDHIYVRSVDVIACLIARVIPLDQVPAPVRWRACSAPAAICPGSGVGTGVAVGRGVVTVVPPSCRCPPRRARPRPRPSRPEQPEDHQRQHRVGDGADRAGIVAKPHLRTHFNPSNGAELGWRLEGAGDKLYLWLPRSGPGIAGAHRAAERIGRLI